jgi:hypothetical protein
VKKSFLVLIIAIVLLVGTNSIVNAEPETKNTLHVSYADGTAQSYSVLVDVHQKYTIGQSYSWIKDQTSRYNLVSYSIDNGVNVPIPRVARGNFTLDIPTDSSHNVVFFAVPQYPIAINSTATFSPPSPTADNWFDANSDITISLPTTIEIQQGSIRQQITGYSVDQSDTQIIPRKESGIFSTQMHMSSAHNLDFSSILQYHISVISQYGTAIGSGWYDASSTATISVNPPDEFLVRHVVTGWQGHNIKSDSNSAKLVVDAPGTVTAVWSTDYGQAIVIGIIPIGAASVFFVIRNKQKKQPVGVDTVQTPVQPTQTLQEIKPREEEIKQTLEDIKQTLEDIKQPTEEIKSNVDDNYSEEISNYILQKAFEKLDSMRAAGVISDTRYNVLKEKLEKDI